ncbi:MAG: BREX system P-loop protein BrxC, partial [Candidatus Marinimicrobia bacterium]|nr:BREX system P-loop protein BrxC [Candidatus Neomarinimicrobiota bacterium]
KHRYIPYKNDYPFNRICDDRIWIKELKDELALEIISPLHDEYKFFIPAKCILYSANKDGHVIVKLPDDKDLLTEIRICLQTDTYINGKNNTAVSINLKQILRDRADENRTRKERLTGMVDTMLTQAEFYALGKRLKIKGQTTSKALNEAFDHLILNIFYKYSYLIRQFDEPLKEIKQILLSGDITRQQLMMDFEKAEPSDIKEVRSFIDLKTASNQSIILFDLVRHFTGRPYGWGELQSVILITKLFIAGNISLVLDGSRMKPKDAIGPLTKTPQWKNVKIVKRTNLSKAETQKAQNLAKELLGSIAPDGQDQLAQFLRDGLNKWVQMLEKLKPLADTGNYPGKKEIDDCMTTAHTLLKIHDSYELVKAFNAKKEDLKDTSDDLYELNDFYTNQKNTWETLRNAMDRFKPNQSALEKDVDAHKAMQRMSQILSAPRPYEMLKDVNDLISKVEAVNNGLIDNRRESAAQEVDNKIGQISTLLKDNNADPDFSNRSLYPLQEIKKKILTEYSIPQIITYSVNDARELFETVLESIDEAFKPLEKPGQKSKQIKIIKPSNLKQKAYLETVEDVDAFVDKVKNTLLEAVKNNIRILIE